MKYWQEKFESHCGLVTLYLGDSREVLPYVGNVDALVTDPPYGIKEASGKNKTRSNMAVAKDYGTDSWDDATEDDLISLAISKAQSSIVFGGNYYYLPPSSCWLVWDKMNTGDFADCELAWTNLKKAVRKISHRWNGMIREGNEERFHPTQKPLKVMEWCIYQLPDEAHIIIDPFMGSGTTGVASVRLGRRFVGIEKEPRYFEIAKRRIMESLSIPQADASGLKQKRLFTTSS